MDTLYELLPLLFVVALFLNIRASFKLGLDWRGMFTTVRFVRDAYARRSELPTEETIEREAQAPVFLHLVPAYEEPDIDGTVKALCASRDALVSSRTKLTNTVKSQLRGRLVSSCPRRSKAMPIAIRAQWTALETTDLAAVNAKLEAAGVETLTKTPSSEK